MEEKPTYYAIIPADVRYDPDLRANEKLMYGEITALSSKEGYCWATNEYFSELYGVGISTVSEWISHLKSKGYIEVEVLRKGKAITQRRICLRENQKGYSDFSEEGSSEKADEGLRKKPKDNNTRVNTTSINNKKEHTKFVPPTIEEVEAYVNEKGLHVNPSTFYNYFTEGNWTDSKGNKVKSWKQKLLTWESMRKDKTENKTQIGEVL